MQVHVGDFGAQNRALNHLCAKFEGPAETGAQTVFTCDEPIEGTKVFISSYVTRDISTYDDVVNMEEIILFGAKI